MLSGLLNREWPFFPLLGYTLAFSVYAMYLSHNSLLASNGARMSIQQLQGYININLWQFVFQENVATVLTLW